MTDDAREMRFTIEQFEMLVSAAADNRLHDFVDVIVCAVARLGIDSDALSSAVGAEVAARMRERRVAECDA